MSPSLAPTTLVGWLLYGLASTVPSLVWGALEGVRVGRNPLDRELLLRIGDTTEDSYRDVYDAAVTGNHTAEDVRRSLERMERRGLVQRHPDGGWALTDRGRVVATRFARGKGDGEPLTPTEPAEEPTEP